MGRNKEKVQLMTGEFEVLEEASDSYTGRKGVVNSQVLTLVDRDKTPGAAKLKLMLEYRLTEDEKLLYGGKMQGREIVLSINEIEQWSGRFRVRGRLLDVKGLKAPAGETAKK